MIIKVCGMRDTQNIREVEALKPTMMGFICWEGSSRNVAEATAHLPSCIRVGVFVNPQLDYVRRKVNQLKLNRIQLHGNESPQFCQELIAMTGLPVIKAISVRKKEDIQQYRQYKGIADLLLFDTKCKTMGGSGEMFDWDILEAYDGDIPFLLAGGISPNDIERVSQFRHPQFIGIDLNSRFELRQGVKDITSLKHFINKIRA
ncbi:MAG: phosphoribosylanthranilate isomerase [Bacteroidaceae bacterium]|nr:phosphoribosylanthranilate isomerase [Bacteroidaceae bacterium]